MSRKKALIQSYATTTWIIQKQAEGLTHQQMMIQPPFRGNCFNWVLGHILNNRDMALALLGAETLFGEEELARYRRGSGPMTEEAAAVDSERLLDAIRESNSRIAAALEQAAPEALTAIYSEEHQQTVADRIDGLHWHETYHTGQLELLRQLGGVNDAVI
jgi:hypothetical protein